MKRKGIVALPLAMLLAVSSLSVTAFADTTEKSISADAAGQENSETQKKEKKTSGDNASGNVSDSSSKPARPDFGRKHGKKQEVAEPENAIGKDAAKEKALDDAGLTADQTGKVRSRVSSLEDGTVIYKIHFSYNEKLYSYQIDATTGKVLDKSSKEITEEMKNRSLKHRQMDSGSTVSSGASDSSKSTDSSESTESSKPADPSGSSKPAKNSGETSTSST